MRGKSHPRRPLSSPRGRRMETERASRAETFVGLDIHKHVVVATAVDSFGEPIDQSTLGSTDPELIAYLRRLPGTKRVALEACTMWEHFHDAFGSVVEKTTLGVSWRDLA
jgi:hypothetical protein